jgi:2',3'-cyclic-nucleotide 2'-phosphodiesterase (5'-nucleotidase family)
MRTDNVLPEGEFTIKNLKTLLSTSDSLVKIELSGEDLLKTILNGYSKYP